MLKASIKMIMIASAAVFCLLVQFVSSDSAVPKDINSSAVYARESIISLAMKNIISGDKNGNFNPAKPVTRGEMTKFIVNALDISTDNIPENPTFKDVPKSHWAYKYVEAAYRQGIVKGISNGYFGVNNKCTREEISAIISRTFIFSEETYAVNRAHTSLKRFKDNDAISDWARDGVEFVVFNSLMKGTGSSFDPKGYAERQQVAVVIDRLLLKKVKIEELFEIEKYTQVVGSDTGFIFTFTQPVEWITIDQIRDSKGNDTKEFVPPPTAVGSYDYDWAGGYKRVSMDYSNLKKGETYTVRYTFGLKNKKGEMAYGEKTFTYMGNNLFIEYAEPINGSHLRIVFSEEIDSGSAADTRNYTITDDKGNVLAIEQAMPYYDYVDLKLAHPVIGKKAVNLSVSGIKPRINSGQTFAARTLSMVVEDKTSPSFYFKAFDNGKHTTKLILYFSEPVVDGAVKIDGKAIGRAKGESMTIDGLMLDGTLNHFISVDGLSDGVNISGGTSTLQNFLEPPVNEKAKPTIVDTSFIKDEDGRVTKIILGFDKGIKGDAGYSGALIDAFDGSSKSIKASDITYDPFNNPVKSRIQLVCYTSREVKEGAFEVVFPIGNAINLYGGTYTFKFPEGLVSGIDGSPNAESTRIIDFSTTPRAVEKKTDSSESSSGQAPEEGFGIPANVRLNLNGDFVNFDIQPVIHEEELFVPISLFDKYYLESFHSSYDKRRDTVFLERVAGAYPKTAVQSLVIKEGSNKAFINFTGNPNYTGDLNELYENEADYKDELLLLNAAPKVVKGTMMVPAESIVESLGGEFSWDKGSNIVYIRDSTVKKYPELYYTLRKSFYFQYRGEIDSTVNIKVMGRKTKTNYLNFNMNTEREFNGDNIHIKVSGSAEGNELEKRNIRYEEIKVSDKLYTRDFDKNEWNESSTQEGLWSLEGIVGQSYQDSYGGLEPYGELIRDYSSYPFINEGEVTIGGSKAVKYKAALSSHDLKLLVPQQDYQEVSSLISNIFDDSMNYTVELYLNDKSQIVREVGRLTAPGKSESEDVDISIEVIVDYKNIWSDIIILPPKDPNVGPRSKDGQGFAEIGVK